MKLNFPHFAGRLRAKTVLFLTGLILIPGLVRGQMPYTNFTGTVNNPPPQVDATTFVNNAIWNISTAPSPYATAHTLNYTNESTMNGSVGWEFDYGPSTGGNPNGRGMSANFFNDNSGTIQAVDGTITVPPRSPFSTTVSYLLVSASNIVNKGTLISGANGEIVLNGSTVSLARSGLEIIPISGVGSSNGTNSFTPDTAITDELWQISTNLQVGGSFWDGTNLGQLSFTGASEPCGQTGVAAGTAGPTTPPQIADSYVANLFPYTVTLTNSSGNPSTNITLYSNVVEQASFVGVSDPNISAASRFGPALVSTNPFKTVAVQFTAVLSNVVTRASENDSLYVVDDLASSTNFTLLPNSFVNPLSSCTSPSYRPSSVIVSRSDPGFFAGGNPGLGRPPSDFFFILTMNTLNYSNAVTAVSNPPSGFVVGRSDLYEANVDNLPAPVPSAGEGENISNVAGRITINADNLDLTRTRMRGESLITIDATNLIGSVGAAIDCQNLSYNLGSTTGLINVTNLVNPTVTRLHGTVEEWSGVWTNFIIVVFPNNYAPVVNNNVTNWVLTPLTNLVEVDSAVTVVDGTGLSSTVQTAVHDLVLNSTNMVISDSYVDVVDELLLNGSSLTINSSSELYLDPFGSVLTWNSAIAPALQYFTNNGFLLIPNQAHFGDDTASPYVEFVNTGYITANSQNIRSLDLQITGGITDAGGDFSAVAQSMEITGPTFFPLDIYANSIYASGSINLYANTVQLNQAALSAGNQINLYVTNSLSDFGSASALTCNNGFNLWVAPATGNLAGTAVTNTAPGSEEIDNAWAGVDYGPTGLPEAFTHNAPIGTLLLVAQNPSLLPLFVFSGTGGAPSNAMYVTTLDLSQLTSNAGDLASMIQINPGMKIYVAQVILGFTPPGGQSPIAYVQSQFPNQIVAMPNIVVTQSGSVDWNTTYQAIDGFGASSAYDGTWSTSQADILFSTNMAVIFNDNHLNRYTNNGIGLSLLRNHIVWASTPLASDTPTTVETNIMLLAQQRGARVWSTPWTPAAGFKSIYDIYDSGIATGGGIDGGSFRGGTATNLAYASQLANYVASMTNYGIHLYAISIQNEPDADVTSYDACQWTGTQIHDFVTNLYVALAAKGVGSTKIILPESQNWQDYQNLAGPAMTDPTVAADVGIIADHNYDGATGPASLVKNGYGKPLWETEVSQLSGEKNDIANGVYYADRIYQFLTVAQASAWHYWWIFPYGSETGLMSQQGGPTKRMFTVGQFSRFVRPGYVRIGASAGGGDLLVTAFKDTNSQSFAIVAINTNANIDVTQTFSLANVLGVSAVTPWMTSASNSLAQLPPVAVSGSAFTYTVPAQSVVTFVGQGNAAPSSIAISGASYASSGHSFVLTWNSTAGATYSVLKTNVLGGSTVNWPVLVTGYPTGGAAGGSLSYTDATATVSPAFYRIRSP